MSDTTFTNGVTLTDAAWFQDLNDYTYKSAMKWCGTAGGTADAITITPVSTNLAPTALTSGMSFTYKSGSSANTGAMTVAVSGLTAKAIQSGGSALTAGQHAANSWYRVTYDGTAFQIEPLSLGSSSSGGITLQTPAATTSGTSIDYTGLSSLKRISLMMNGVSTSGSSVPIVQIGPSGGVETSSYTGGASNAGGTWTANSAGFLLKASTHAAADIINGLYVFTLENSSSNTWSMMGCGFWSSTLQQGLSSGTKALAGALSRFRLTTAGGTDTFDAGEINLATE